jgi:hypothetical protein
LTDNEQTQTERLQGAVMMEEQATNSDPWFTRLPTVSQIWSKAVAGTIPLPWVFGALVMLFPVGLFFVWQHPQWATKTKWISSIGYGNRPPRLAAAWLKGLAYCGTCGRRMVGRKIGRHVYLVCDTRRKEVSAGLPPTCDFNSVRHDRLVRMLSNEFGTIIDHGKDREMLDAYIKQSKDALQTFLARSAVQEAMFAEMLQLIADRLGIGQKAADSYTALKKQVADAGVSESRLKAAQAEVLRAWDLGIEAELSTINAQLETLADKWIEATGTLADKLKVKVKALDDRKTELEARRSMNILTAYQASIEDFTAFIERCKAFRTADLDLAKAEALRAILSKIVVNWVPKAVKGKSKVDGYSLEFCGDFADHATACTAPRTGRSVRAGSSGCW